MRSASSPRAVSMMTGMAAVAGSARIAWHDQQAVEPGQHEVEDDQVGGARRSRGSTSRPEVRRSTRCPAFSDSAR